MKENGCGVSVRGAWAVVLGGSLALVAACSEGPKGGERLEVYPVEGEVFVDGQPAEGAMVVLQPVTPRVLPEGTQPVGSTGQVDASGKFTISTYSSGDGAPAGKYGVSVTWIELVGLS
ncbi:MAG: hypothetical protein HQ582_08540, partial [Planctomycetes bacterium]|nr:hypothetical protein [Planctomycetota bacterium]